MSSPPPPYNFAVIPTVASRHPLWEERLNEADARSSLGRGMLLQAGKETIGTSALDAEPDMILEMPEDTFAPLLPHGRPGAGVRRPAAQDSGGWWASVRRRCALALLAWLWPRRELREREPAHG